MADSTQTQSFLSKYWGWFVLAAFVGLLIYLLFHKNTPLDDFRKDKKTIDSLKSVIIQEQKQRIKDSITYEIESDVWKSKNDSFSVVANDLKERKNNLEFENDQLKKQIELSGSDTSLYICNKYLKITVERMDSLQSIAGSYQIFQGARDEYYQSIIDEVTKHANKSDSLFVWSTNVALQMSSKYDTLYKSNKKVQSQLKVSRTEVKIGAGLLLVAIGWILSTQIHIK